MVYHITMNTWQWESRCVYFLHVLDKDFYGSLFSCIVTRCIFWYGCLRVTVRAELLQWSTSKSITALRPVSTSWATQHHTVQHGQSKAQVLKESAPGFEPNPLDMLISTAQGRSGICCVQCMAGAKAWQDILICGPGFIFHCWSRVRSRLLNAFRH